MESLNKKQWHVFTAFCVVTAMALALRLGVMVPLLLGNNLQQRAGDIIQATALREGWLSSGLSLKYISSERVKLLYREFHRGTDTVHCQKILLHTGALESCSR